MVRADCAEVRCDTRFRGQPVGSQCGQRHYSGASDGASVIRWTSSRYLPPRQCEVLDSPRGIVPVGRKPLGPRRCSSARAHRDEIADPQHNSGLLRWVTGSSRATTLQPWISIRQSQEARAGRYILQPAGSSAAQRSSIATWSAGETMRSCSVKSTITNCVVALPLQLANDSRTRCSIEPNSWASVLRGSMSRRMSEFVM